MSLELPDLFAREQEDLVPEAEREAVGAVELGGGGRRSAAVSRRSLSLFLGTKTLDDILEAIDDGGQGCIGLVCDAVCGGLDTVVEGLVGGCADVVVEGLVGVVGE